MSLLLLIRMSLWAAGLTILTAAAANDLRVRLIPNPLVISVALVGLALGVLSGPVTMLVSLAAALAVLVGLGVLAHFRFVGGGDVKLIAAVSLMVPPDRIAALLAAIAIAGGVVSTFYLVAHHALRRTRFAIDAANIPETRKGWLHDEQARIAAGKSLPFGVAILAGVAAYATIELHRCLFATFCSL